MKWTQAEVEQMKHVENRLSRVLLEFKENTPAMLMVFALVRCARVLLRKHSREMQKSMVPLLTSFIEGKVRAPGTDSPLIMLPGDDRIHQ